MRMQFAENRFKALVVFLDNAPEPFSTWGKVGDIIKRIFTRREGASFRK